MFKAINEEKYQFKVLLGKQAAAARSGPDTVAVVAWIEGGTREGASAGFVWLCATHQNLAKSSIFYTDEKMHEHEGFCGGWDPKWAAAVSGGLPHDKCNSMFSWAWVPGWD